MYAKRFKVNRPLTEKERKDSLPKDLSAYAAPRGMAGMVKMNSTYLECVDKYFFGKGTISTGSIFGMTLSICLFLGILFALSWRWRMVSDEHAEIVATAVGFFIICSPLFAYCLRDFRKESKWTHRPIRFNRKNQKVYVFRHEGTVLTANWQDIYFTVFPLPFGLSRWMMCNIVGHILDKDGETVLETFALPLFAESAPEGSGEDLETYAQWEFIRRYMEGDDQTVKDLMTRVGTLQHVSHRKETWWEGVLANFLFYTHDKERPKDVLNNFGVFLWGKLMLFPFTFSFARALTMRLAKIPKWSTEIEAECAVDPNDPLLCDEDHPPPKG